MVEQNPEKKSELPHPEKRNLQLDVKKEFESEDAAVPVSMLLGFLWEDQEIFDTFSNRFLAEFCEKWIYTDELKVAKFMGLVVHRLFTDLTAQVQDWRVVTIQERFIHLMI